MPEGKLLSTEDVLEQERLARGGDAGAPDSALCISGGGIRSATFALGVLQALAGRGLLQRFDYLSTVSGGGYIGSWLTAWVHRAGNVEEVAQRLRPDAPPPKPGEPNPVQHLRDYNSYLAPERGAFSTDLWTVITTVIRNIVLNWLVLVPLMLFVVALPRLFLSLLSFPERLFRTTIYAGSTIHWDAPQLDVISGSTVVSVGVPLLSALLFTIALFNMLRYLPGIGGRNHTRYDYVVGIVLPLVGAVLLFLVFDSLFYLGSHYTDYSHLWRLVSWTAAPFVAALVIYVPFHRRQAGRLRLLFSPLPLAVAVMAAGTGVSTWAVTNLVIWNPDTQKIQSWAQYVTCGPPLILVGVVLAAFLFTGLSSPVLADEDREWMARASAGVLLVSVAWFALCFLVLMVPHYLLGWRTWTPGLVAGLGGLSGWLSTLSERRNNGNSGTDVSTHQKGPLAIVSKLAQPVFLALFAVLLSIALNVVVGAVHRLARAPMIDRWGDNVTWSDHYGMLTAARPDLAALVAFGFLALCWVAARFVNINTFSLHGMYRDRLVRAYLGASNPNRNASAFTGMSDSDDFPLHQIAPDQKPFHVLNLTLNLVSTTRLAWQERKAASFTASPLHCGSADLAYRPADRYAGAMSLGSAVAISGAAASPAMGYRTSRVTAFIMTLFNARLGSWLGNPGSPGERTWTQDSPRSAIGLLAKEALGLTSDRSPYVYLSDGGHFENLALYEMVRRRCRTIVVLDGGCDPDFRYQDLGNALRKIRIDFGIPIDFADQDLDPLRQRRARCAVATIRYSALESESADGWLLYIKPLLLGTEPPDVFSYAALHPTFPHQTTADQFFDESQTESYRQLGQHTLEEIADGWREGSLDDFVHHVQSAYLQSTESRPAAD